MLVVVQIVRQKSEIKSISEKHSHHIIYLCFNSLLSKFQSLTRRANFITSVPQPNY